MSMLAMAWDGFGPTRRSTCGVWSELPEPGRAGQYGTSPKSPPRRQLTAPVCQFPGAEPGTGPDAYPIESSAPRFGSEWACGRRCAAFPHREPSRG